VTGRARFGADYNLPGQLIGRVLRSPHPARAHRVHRHLEGGGAAGREGRGYPGGLRRPALRVVPAGEMMMNYKDVVRNVMARRGRRLYEGHAVAAVAATSAVIARSALKLIDVKYEVLPHVIDVVEAMQPGAPLLHDDLFTVGVEPKPEKPSNIAKRVEIKQGDMEAGFTQADIVVEREFKTAPVHTRATSSRTPYWPPPPRTARPSSGARPRATTSCAPTAPGSSASTSARSG